MPTLTSAVETFPIAGRFAIARGAKTEAHVVTVTISDGEHKGRGECVPYARYGESVESVLAAIEAAAPALEKPPYSGRVHDLLPRGAARNAIDCALWDLEAKVTGVRAYARAGLARPKPVVTAFTISLDAPDIMGEAARAQAKRPLLKIKLGGERDEDVSRLQAVRAGAPDTKLIIDANEGWDPDDLERLLAACAEAGVVLVEQPLPGNDDGLLAEIPHPVPVCADESMHDRDGLAALRDRYDAVNIKLDKTGGLTEALAVAEEAARLGFTLMVGCMVGTSLAMAPALLLAPQATFVDLDGPLLLARDRPDGLAFDGSTIAPAEPALWG